jgi:hypothetical protein
MALPATDSFTNDDDTNLTDHSASWTYNRNAHLIITSNALRPGIAADTAAHWNADAFADNQYAEGEIVAVAGGVYMGPAVRCHATEVTYYLYYGDSADGAYLEKFDDGVFTQLGDKGDVFVVNSIYRIEAEGTTITPFVDSVEDASIGAQTDGAIGSGSAGVIGWGNSSGTRLDDWEGGNLDAGTEFPFSDDWTGADFAEWNMAKWTTVAG